MRSASCFWRIITQSLSTPRKFWRKIQVSGVSWWKILFLGTEAGCFLHQIMWRRCSDEQRLMWVHGIPKRLKRIMVGWGSWTPAWPKHAPVNCSTLKTYSSRRTRLTGRCCKARCSNDHWREVAMMSFDLLVDRWSQATLRLELWLACKSVTTHLVKSCWRFPFLFCYQTYETSIDTEKIMELCTV